MRFAPALSLVGLAAAILADAKASGAGAAAGARL